MVNKVQGPNNPDGYKKITLYDQKTHEKKTYLVPVGKELSLGGKTFDIDKGKNNEFVIKGSKKDENFKLTGIALEHLDPNKDGKIDKKDSDQNMANKINKKLLDTPYYIKNTEEYSDAGIDKGEGIVVFSKENEGQIYHVGLFDKPKE